MVDTCLIPEISFHMDKLCLHIAKRFDTKGHAVICVAEGAGQVGIGSVLLGPHDCTELVLVYRSGIVYR